MTLSRNGGGIRTNPITRTDYKKGWKSLIIYFGIWKSRNDSIFRGEGRSEKRIVASALNEWMEYKEEQRKTQGSRILEQVQKEQEHWRKPEIDFVQLSVSSITAPGSRNIGCGFHAQDDDGVLIQAWAVVRE